MTGRLRPSFTAGVHTFNTRQFSLPAGSFSPYVVPGPCREGGGEQQRIAHAAPGLRRWSFLEARGTRDGTGVRNSLEGQRSAAMAAAPPALRARNFDVRRS